jgi:hypothetical protein
MTTGKVIFKVQFKNGHVHMYKHKLSWAIALDAKVVGSNLACPSTGREVHRFMECNFSFLVRSVLRELEPAARAYECLVYSFSAFYKVGTLAYYKPRDPISCKFSRVVGSDTILLVLQFKRDGILCNASNWLPPSLYIHMSDWWKFYEEFYEKYAPFKMCSWIENSQCTYLSRIELIRHRC